VPWDVVFFTDGGGTIRAMCYVCRVASHLFTGGLAGIGKLPALVGWYIRYGITAYNHVFASSLRFYLESC